jgi:hypothetical protein
VLEEPLSEDEDELNAPMKRRFLRLFRPFEVMV